MVIEEMFGGQHWVDEASGLGKAGWHRRTKAAERDAVRAL